MNEYHVRHTTMHLNSLTTKLEKKLDIVRIELFFSRQLKCARASALSLTYLQCARRPALHKCMAENVFIHPKCSLAFALASFVSFSVFCAHLMSVECLTTVPFGAASDIFMVLSI